MNADNKTNPIGPANHLSDTWGYPLRSQPARRANRPLLFHPRTKVTSARYASRRTCPRNPTHESADTPDWQFRSRSTARKVRAYSKAGSKTCGSGQQTSPNRTWQAASPLPIHPCGWWKWGSAGCWRAQQDITTRWQARRYFNSGQ